ncbi:hypothetical protein ACFOEY_20060 [Paracandidimonas soli]|uniref:hypothetical protein n=1 Tax=Paracandidimonas soli TaxID=1917182 RepID=UPI00360A2E58
MLVFPYGIVVNRQGYRFIDEAPGASYETFDRFCHAVQAQEDGVGYAVYDAKMATSRITSARSSATSRRLRQVRWKDWRGNWAFRNRISSKPWSNTMRPASRATSMPSIPMACGRMD